MSYMTGFGWKNPTRVHHRAASIPSVQAQPQKIGCQQGWPYYNSGSGNPNEATGAIVGGPNANDNINDVRSNVEQMEPTNAPVVVVLTVLQPERLFTMFLPLYACCSCVMDAAFGRLDHARWWWYYHLLTAHLLGIMGRPSNISKEFTVVIFGGPAFVCASLVAARKLCWEVCLHCNHLFRRTVRFSAIFGDNVRNLLMIRMRSFGDACTKFYLDSYRYQDYRHPVEENLVLGGQRWIQKTCKFQEWSMMEGNSLTSRILRRHVLVVVAALSWANLVTIALAFSSADYASALDKSLLFYDVQRSGKLPSWQRIKWRGDSGLTDGRANNVDLTGGFYDAGDNVKFGFPLAFTIALLAWDVVEFGSNLRTTGQLQNTLNNIRWGTDYLLKAYTGQNELWVQVGDPNNDHQCWERPEDMDTSRTAYKVDASHPGSDVAAETAAAFASASMAFREADKNYSAKLLSSAKKIFNFADKYRGKYSDSLSGVVCPFYCSYSGFQDELVWGATWLYKASGDNSYLQYLITNANTLGGATTTVNSFDWDNKYAGAQVLIAQLVLSGTQGVQGYKDRADGYICAVLPSSISASSQTSYTPGGLLFHSGQSNLQYVTTATFLLTAYAKRLSAAKATLNCGGRRVTPTQLSSTAQKQVDYILGSNPKGQSYMVGFGTKYPLQVHHRAASLPSIAAHPEKIQCQQGWEYYNSNNPNTNVASGAIIGGPDQDDNLNDVRSNYAQMEPTLYINAPMVGVLAVLATGNNSVLALTDYIYSQYCDISFASDSFASI